MVALEISKDNKFAAAYTNNSQTALLNTLVNEFVIIDNPFSSSEPDSQNPIVGLVVLNTNLVNRNQ